MDRVALITGATSAIGAATAHLFSKTGYAVALVARRLPLLEALAHEIEAEGGLALAIEADVTQSVAMEEMVKKTVQTFGGLDIAFNNAGGGARPTPLADLSPEVFSEAVSVNLTGTFLSMRSQLKAMLARGGGSIVNMSSTAGLQGVAGLAPYCAGKHAIIGLSKAAALDYADKNIRINVVAPGPIATERTDSEQRNRIGRYIPVQRVGEPSEVAELVRWLCSSDARFITGVVVPIDGGRLAGTPSFVVGS
ncbi:MAG TPA: SDR family NAD(P)-dependent oxidoreductase [Candidatus Eremiobacteraceae bacterium]